MTVDEERGEETTGREREREEGRRGRKINVDKQRDLYKCKETHELEASSHRQLHGA